MRWNYLLVEVYCFDPTCDKPYVDHLEHRQGGWCEGHLGGFLAMLGLRRILRELCAVWWEEFWSGLRWHLWGRWTYDDEKFMKWIEERTPKPGECPVADEWLDAEKWRCHFPDSLEERDV